MGDGDAGGQGNGLAEVDQPDAHLLLVVDEQQRTADKLLEWKVLKILTYRHFPNYNFIFNYLVRFEEL